MDTQALTLLVVEDEALILYSACEELRELGFKILEASNGHEAMAHMQSGQKIDLIFTDINMPGPMNGLDLANIASLRDPPIGIIVTSGKDIRPADRLPAGAVFLPKPYVVEQVASIAADLLR